MYPISLPLHLTCQPQTLSKKFRKNLPTSPHNRQETHHPEVIDLDIIDQFQNVLRYDQAKSFPGYACLPSDLSEKPARDCGKEYAPTTACDTMRHCRTTYLPHICHNVAPQFVIRPACTVSFFCIKYCDRSQESWQPLPYFRTFSARC
jgi:hypothetical protein